MFQKEKLPEVEAVLIEQGYPGATVVDVRSLGMDSADRSSYLKLEVLVANDHAYRVANAITRTARLEARGEGRICISPVDHL